MAGGNKRSYVPYTNNKFLTMVLSKYVWYKFFTFWQNVLQCKRMYDEEAKDLEFQKKFKSR